MFCQADTQLKYVFGMLTELSLYNIKNLESSNIYNMVSEPHIFSVKSSLICFSLFIAG